MSDRFSQLIQFINVEMRMSHIYQPAMLLALINKGGTASTTEIARTLLSHDMSQVEYYERIVTRYPGTVLSKRHITEKQKRTYQLLDFDQLSDSEIDTLREACTRKIEEFIEVRGKQPWAHRRTSSEPISGTIRYEVLKNAKSRCELCGVSAQVRALEVDHILPRNHGGSNDISNLQALCYSCNAMKRDRDDTDFRGVAEAYEFREKNCYYCEVPEHLIISSNELCFSMQGQDSQNNTHTLVIPKRHASNYLDLYKPEINAVHSLFIDISKQESTSFDIHIDSPNDMGLSASHCHVRLIPR